MDAFDEVGIFLELIGLFLFVRGLLKFEFLYFNLFRLVYFKFQSNPQDNTILFSFPVAVFPRVIILVSVHGGRICGMLIEIICEQFHCYQVDPNVSTTFTHTWQ